MSSAMSSIGAFRYEHNLAAMMETEIEHDLPIKNEIIEEDEEFEDNETDSSEEVLRCNECEVNFTTRHYLYNHLLHHIKQPKVFIVPIKEPITLAPIKIILKNNKENGFEIISSPQASPTGSAGTSPKRTTSTPDKPPEDENSHDSENETLDKDSDNADNPLEDIQLDTGDDNMMIEEITDEGNMAFSPNFAECGETVEEEVNSPRSTDSPRNTDSKTLDYNTIPGAEPTPPPEPSPEFPKIRIKSGLLKESLTITEITDDNPNGEFNQGEFQSMDNSYSNWATPSLEDPLRLPDAAETDSTLLSNLFTNNNDRAKDLGFTTSDTEFISLDSRAASNALQVYSSSNNSMTSSNPLDTLSNLPMQQLAQQVSRLQPNSGGMHQQNVLINIQQFPQAPPPQPHYQNHMYPPHPPQPMYHQPYQYTPPNPMYYPQAPPTYPHMPPHQRHQMQQQAMPPPNQQMPIQQHSQQPNGPQPQQYRQQAPRQQQPPAPRPSSQQGQRPPMQPRSGGMQQMAAPRQYNPRQPIGMRQRAPIIRGRGGAMIGTRGPRPRMPMQNGQSAPQQQMGPRMIKRSPETIAALQAQAKRKKMDVLVPDKHDDADCQVVAVTPKNTGLPQIQSIQGNVSEPADNSIMHLSDSITLSVRNPPPKAPSPKRSDAKDVANILATRGITVTAAPKSKETKSSSKSPEPSVPPVAINLNSSVCIIPTNKSNSSSTTNNTNNKSEKLQTVDLTDDANESSTSLKHQQKPQQPPTNKVLPFQCDLCPAKYPNSLSLNKHRQTFHKTGTSCDYGVPLIDLKTPGIMQRLASIGIHNYIPLPGANSESTFALPIINSNTYKNGNLNSIGISTVLTLGPIRMLPNRPQQKQ